MAAKPEVASSPEKSGEPAAVETKPIEASGTKAMSVYTIAKVADNDVHLYGVYSGVTKIMTVVAFVALARLSSGGDITQHHPGWPDKRAFAAAHGEEVRMKSRVLVALDILVDLLGGASDALLDVHEQPSRQVVANTLIPPGELTLAPETLVVRSVKESDWPSVRGLKPFGPVQVECKPSGPSGMRFLLEPRFSREDCCPFWCVSPTADPNSANVVLTPYRVQLLGGADPVQARPKASRRKLGKKHADSVKTAVGKKEGEIEVDESDRVAQRECEIPVLTNTVAIKPGTPLRIFFKPPPVEKKSKAAPITVGQIQKRARV